MLENKIAIKYSRVSTNMQDKRGSKVGQEKEIDKYAIENNFTIIAEFTDTDHGDVRERKGIKELKEYLRVNKMIKYVLVYHSDRFTRSFQNGMKDLFFLEEMDVTLISTMEGEIKVDGTYSSLPSLVRLIGAQEDKTKIIEKSKTALYNYAETNKYLGGSIYPWFQLEKGYINGRKSKIIVANKETWIFYRNFFLDIIKYRSLRTACKKNGINETTATLWVNSKELIGYRTYGKRKRINQNSYEKKRVKEYFISKEPVFPKILSQEEYEQILGMRNKKRSIYKDSTFVYIYSNLIYCNCGEHLYGKEIKKKSKKDRRRINKVYHYYACKGCGTHFPVEKLENKISQKIVQSPSIKILNDYEFRISDIMDEITALRMKLSELEEGQEDILKLVSERLVKRETAEKQLKKINVKIKDIKRSIREKKLTLKNETEKDIKEDNIKLLKYLLENVTEETRIDLKEIVNLLIKKIIVIDLENIQIIF